MPKLKVTLPASPRRPKPIPPPIYLRDHAAANSALKKLQPRTVWLELAWWPFASGGAQHPHALLQVASGPTVLLLQLSAMQRLPERLERLLRNQDVVKVGADIRASCEKLFHLYDVTHVRSCVDLASLARGVAMRPAQGAPLAELAKAYAHCAASTTPLQHDKWKDDLTPAQQADTAGRACAGLAAYAALAEKAGGTADGALPRFDIIHGPVDPPGALPKPSKATVERPSAASSTASASRLVPPATPALAPPSKEAKPRRRQAKPTTSHRLLNLALIVGTAGIAYLCAFARP